MSWMLPFLLLTMSPVSAKEVDKEALSFLQELYDKLS